jgi:hypothetical protein
MKSEFYRVNKHEAKSLKGIMTKVANAVLYCFYNSDKKISYHSLQYELDEKFKYYEVDSALKELEDLQLLNTRPDNTGQHWCVLKQKVREEISILRKTLKIIPTDTLDGKNTKKNRKKQLRNGMRQRTKD